MLADVFNLFADDISPQWQDEMTAWGEGVGIYRSYVRGEHDVYLTPVMRKMLNLRGRRFETFSADYTDMVVRMMSERLVVEGIDAVSSGTDAPPSDAGDDDAVDELQVWVDELLKKNRFDALQMDVHEATIRDGDAFVIVDYDDEKQCARFNFNEAWDGDVGVLPIYSRANPRKMMAAVKVAYKTAEQKEATVYYPDKVVVYNTDSTGGGFTQAGDEVPWLPGVLPVVQFSNRRRSFQSTGVSELQKMISIQDMLNRTLVSMVMASEFTAFQTFVSLGFRPEGAVTPGSIISWIPENFDDLQYVDFKAMPQGTLTPFIDEINKFIDLISEVTQTPIASVLGSNPSGEALKQRESMLLTKIQGAHVKLGNAWEDLLMVAHAVEMTFKAQNKPPKVVMFDTLWRDASVRNDLEVASIAGMVFDKMQSKPLYLEMMSAVTGWDEQRRKQILAEDARQVAETMGGFSNLLGDLGDLSLNLNGVA